MKQTMLSAATMLAVGMLVAMPSAAVAASDQTFSFESPSAGSYTYNPTTYAGVTFNAHSGVAAQGSAFFNTTPPDGTQAAFIQSVYGSAPGDIGAVSFALTGLSAGTSYDTTFYAAQRANNFGNTPLNVSFNGTLLGTYSATSRDFTQFTVPSFIATGSTGTLTFAGSPSVTGDDDVIVDLVRVSAAASPPAAVPEPATWAMMLGGFGLVGGAMRRRKASPGVTFA